MAANFEFGDRIDFDRNQCSFAVAMEEAVSRAGKRWQSGSWSVGRVVVEVAGSLGLSLVLQSSGSLLQRLAKAACSLRWQYAHRRRLTSVLQT